MKPFTKLLAGVALVTAAFSIRAWTRGKPEAEQPATPSPKVNLSITRDDGETLATFHVDRDLID